MLTFENFTDEEKSLLTPYVTNTDLSVFVLTNLPEVIKGALFSRYSRSTLGLRKLLLKEFIQNKESAFQQIQGLSQPQANAAEASQLAIAKAQDFYDRILDGYGDDSIGELGGAHLALENVSILATKTIQDSRIGGSPLEKSTRYVTFNKKVNGDYLYYKDPRIMASAWADEYVSLQRYLFDTYASLIDPITEVVKVQMARQADVDEAAYLRSVKAKVFDLIRGLLPAATLTNMGVYGNGRFFEYLISKMQIQDLTELRYTGNAMVKELGKVIPSFIRRAEEQHRHFISYRDYQKQLTQVQLHWLRQLQLTASSPSDMTSKAAPATQGVTLLDYDSDAEVKIIALMLYPYVDLSLEDLRQILQGLSAAELDVWIDQIVEPRQNRRMRVTRALETVFYTFELVGDFGMYRDLHRHRVLTQERQHLSTKHGYYLPSEIADTPSRDIYIQAMERADQFYQKLAVDFPQEAQYVVPLAYHIRWTVKINLRALTWLVELRSTPQGHESYRKAAQQMVECVERVHPRICKFLKFVDKEDYTLGRLNSEIRSGAKNQTIENE